MRLIDANALSRAVCGIGKDIKRPRAVELMCLVLISEALTVDAVEVVHGRWLPYHEADIGYDEYGIRCSNCRLEFENHEVTFPTNYCPNCGAKMDGDGNGT